MTTKWWRCPACQGIYADPQNPTPTQAADEPYRHACAGRDENTESDEQRTAARIPVADGPAAVQARVDAAQVGWTKPQKDAAAAILTANADKAV